jgi:hypothetical protein
MFASRPHFYQRKPIFDQVEPLLVQLARVRRGLCRESGIDELTGSMESLAFRISLFEEVRSFFVGVRKSDNREPPHKP